MRLICVAGEERRSPDYHFFGRFRQGETHCFFQYTLAGYGAYRDSTGEYELEPGMGFLCRAANPLVEYYYPPKAQEPWNFIWIAFAGDAAITLTNELVGRFGPIFRLPLDSPILRQFSDYENTCAGKSELNDFDAEINLELDSCSSGRMVSDFLLALGDSASGSYGEGSNALLVKRAQRIIRSESVQGINVTELARSLDISREHLSRVFREETGLSPYQYILRQRIFKACRLLKETQLSQKEIARMLGYNAVENFSRAFTRVMKHNPGDFRKYGAPPVE